MKKFRRILLAIVIVIFMVLKITFEISDGEILIISPIKVNAVNDVYMYVKSNTVTSTGATFVLENNSDIYYIYGDYYHLEKKRCLVCTYIDKYI